MARKKRSARPKQKKVKTASAPPLESDFFEVAADGNPQPSDRARKLDELRKDKDFLPETMKVRDGLLDLQRRDREVFNRFFLTANYAAAFSPSLIDRLISGTEDWEILKNLFDYARRFNVWIRPKSDKTGLRASVEPPFTSKFQGQLVDGRFVDVGLEPLWEKWGNLDALEIDIPNADLKKMVDSGRANYVEAHDQSGTSALNDLERIAYNPNKLTFVIHNPRSKMPCVFLLLGERTKKGDWRKAETIITALQRQLYGRVNAGRPAKDPAKDFEAAQELRKTDGRNQKEKAAALFLKKDEFKKSAEVKLSRIKKRYNPKGG